jgi:glutamyl-Q tRNA(Asp) synthetase
MGLAAAAAATKLGAGLAFTELDEDGAARAVEAGPERWGDAVIVRKDVDASYHLAVVVDDAWQGVTHVTRGRDLYAATGLHRLLQVLLDLPAPLSPPSPDHGRRGPQARQERARHEPTVAQGGGCTPADIRRMVGLR